MNVVQIIFSPTGGTRRAAEIIAAELGTAGAVVDLTEAGADFSSVTLNKDDVAIIAAPSFAGRVPALAAARLAQIRGGCAACVALCARLRGHAARIKRRGLALRLPRRRWRRGGRRTLRRARLRGGAA